MKLASLKSGRDGALVVVSRDLTRCVAAAHIAPTLQHAMDHWHEAAPRLMRVYDLMNEGPVAGEKPFDPKDCASPLPRAYQWADGSAYVTHVELVRKARQAEMPPSFWTDPLMYQGGSDSFIGHAIRSSPATKPGASISRPRSRSLPTTCRWARKRARRKSTSNC
ncbi:MAG: hypothetical protein WDM89_00975 [Rhizomicrobium sp.]